MKFRAMSYKGYVMRPNMTNEVGKQILVCDTCSGWCHLTRLGVDGETKLGRTLREKDVVMRTIFVYVYRVACPIMGCLDLGNEFSGCIKAEAELWLRRKPTACHLKILELIPGQSMWDLCWKKMTLGQPSLRVLRVVPVSIIPPKLHNLPFTFHRTRNLESRQLLLQHFKIKVGAF